MRFCKIDFFNGRRILNGLSNNAGGYERDHDRTIGKEQAKKKEEQERKAKEEALKKIIELEQKIHELQKPRKK